VAAKRWLIANPFTPREWRQSIQSLLLARRPYRAIAVKRLRRYCASLRLLRDDRADAMGRLAPKATRASALGLAGERGSGRCADYRLWGVDVSLQSCSAKRAALFKLKRPYDHSNLCNKSTVNFK
jgi:hypothetical protein